MNKRPFHQKIVAWTLIAAMVNPALMWPAYGRDSDIYLTVSGGVTTAEPNIAIILDTSDSMNIPAAWTEYPGAYDSHVEYLWNDPTLVGTGAEQTVASNATISTAVEPVLTTPGSWAGATLAARQALWNAAKAYVLATEAGDPGPRGPYYRNYSDLSWIYWLPAGTADTDPLLRAVTFNRFRGGIKTINGTRGGIAFTGTTDYRGFNRCRDSGNDPAVSVGGGVFHTGRSATMDPVDPTLPQGLAPSTVYAPTGAPRNNGRYLNQQWLRWERFLNLRTGKINVSELDGSGGIVYPLTNPTAGAQVAFPGYAAGVQRPISAGPPTSGFGNVGNNIQGRTATIADPSIGSEISNAVRDSWPATAPFGNGVNYIGDRGQPIRVRRDRDAVNLVDVGTDSRSGWTAPKADLGGFWFAEYMPGYQAAGILTQVLSWYGIAVGGNYAPAVAWLGNRDQTGGSAPASHAVTVGTPAYYNVGAVPGDINNGSCTVNLQLNKTAGFVVGNVINIPGASNVAGNLLVTTITAVNGPGGTFTVSPCATRSTGGDVPISMNLKVDVAVAPTSTLRCTVNYVLDRDNSGAPNPALAASVVGGFGNPDASGANRSFVKPNAKCLILNRVNQGGTNCTGGEGAVKNPLGSANFVTARYNSCAWSGRSSKYVEGVGTYYYGGTCGAASTCTDKGGCAAPGSATIPFRSSSYIRNNNCTTSGLSNLTVGGTDMAGALLNNAGGGCNNKPDVALSCNAREPGGANGSPCIYDNTQCPSENYFDTAGGSAGTADYAVFVNAARDNELPHDCVADNGTVGNPASSYLNGRNDIRFNSAYNLAVSAAANPTAAYNSDSGSAAAGPAIDSYSVNWLNWKFGPKGPNSHPIGRKTRLQIAKDALTTLVQTTDAVRFGLMVFNRTAGCTTSTGTINVNVAPVDPYDPPIAPTVLTLSDNPGFVIGQAISITGAGAAGATLNTTITDIQPNNNVPPGDPAKVDLTLAAAASTNVNETNISANPCAGAVSAEGANVAKRILRMGNNPADLPDYDNRATLINAINAVTASSRTPLTESLYEAYRYFGGRTPRFGTSTASAIVGGTVTQGRDTQAVCSAVSADCPAIGLYRSPMLNNPTTVAPAGCQKNFVVLITDGGPEDDFAANTDIKRLSYAGVLGTVSPRTTVDAGNPDTVTDQFETGGVRYGPTDLAGTAIDGGYIWLDELAYFMSRADVSPGALNLPGDNGPDLIPGRQSVVTYTVGFAGGNSPVLQNASAGAGGGYYVAENSSALGAALNAALVAIRDWNPTAAAPSVPISALNRSENATDVFLAFFQPDPSSTWLGTVKKFALSSSAADCGPGISLCLIGQTLLTKAAPNPSPVKNIETITVDPVTNTQEVAVDPNASSFWAPSTVLDGSNPDQGGTGYQLLNTGGYDPSTRNVYTFLSGGTSTSADLTHVSNAAKETNANITGTLLGNVGMTAATRATLINFARGGSPSDGNCNDASSATACTAWRNWPHGAVEHSKPLVITYDAVATPAVQYLYFLGNDGLLHAVDTVTGKEKWSFLIEEAIPQIAAQMADNAGPEIAIADGSLAVYQTDDNADGIVNGADKVWLYFGLRRGGRVYYSLDITLKDSPQFKWKISANSGAGMVCTGTGACIANADYNELAQTWSTPQVVKVRALGTGTPALIFGGGYDPNQDGVPPAATADTMGRAVYIVNGDTAQALNWFGAAGSGTMIAGTMTYSIPSDVTAINSDSDAQGYIDRLYVGDMGGNVWRFDINDATPGNWRGKQIADLSGGTTPRRKIFFAPPAVKQNVPERYDAVYVGTGDREHPLNTPTTPVVAPPDKIFMVMDRDVGLTMGGAAAAVFPGDFLALGNANTGGIVVADLTSYKGWYRDLDDGEKVINPPTVFFQKLRFGTYAPLSATNACTPAGEGRLNEIDALTGALFNLNSGDPLNPSDRYYSSFVTRGYISSGQLIIQGKNIFHITVSDARLQSILIGTIGGASKIYWYMEPEQ